MKADRRDAATQDAQSYGAVRSFGFMRQPARSCTNFILFSLHSSFYLFRWMMSAVFREEPNLRVGPLLVFCFVLVWFFFSFCLVGWFSIFLSLVLSASPLVFLGWWSCHLKSIYYIIRSNFYFEVA